jgi:predicted PurR-regulated permease PerM
MVKKVEISYRTIIFTVFFLISIWLIYQIRFILLSIFVAVVFMSALNQIVDRLAKLKIPRVIAVGIIYAVFLVLLSLAIGGIVPTLVEQTTVLVNRFPDYLHMIGITEVDPRTFQDQLAQFGFAPSNVFKMGLSIFSNLLSFIAILVLTFYLLLERRNLNSYLSVFFGQGKEQKAEKIITAIERSLGNWVRAEIILMSIIGVFTYVGLLILGIDYALPLALLAGLMEIVPNFGPIVSAIPAVVTGFAISPVTGTAVVALYFLVHQLENGLVVPKVMQKTVGFNPIITLLVLMIGFKLGGAVGALLAIPLVLALKVFIQEYFPSVKLI